ncbi:glycoside hydrolase family 2 TIM barrel-domain containing protein [Microbacterium sp. Be9]|uniref:glycoside hydrolase family 2 TIM barrel-domain containing protein n=1 Tax=Microbacterium sp. Be9 TaxID=2720211 RepID=UPI0014221D36|nr:glycoside hydrolase family 2 TIM barrel-domain containing protein [Microbacterium sp. Be9]NIG66797.1 DUF4982 domain-containing protein [Microbacterium sp. Be9]
MNLAEWRFRRGDPSGAAMPAFDDGEWRAVTVPHDWSVEAPFDSELEGATGYLPGGIGWYRTTFSAPDTTVAQLVFDGVYNNATVYLNGERVAEHPYGYSPFVVEVGGRLHPHGNVLAVRVDHSHYADSRWYTGSGIYRPVKLVGGGAIHIPVWGTFVSTPEVSADIAIVQVETEIVGVASGALVKTDVFDGEGAHVATSTTSATSQTVQTLTVRRPYRWSPSTPHVYRAVSTVSFNGEVVDEVTTSFGIRSLRFDPDEGFFLNDERMLIKGVCLHHDAGCVGAAVPRDVWRRRLAALRDAGANAVRISHNPGAEEFLDLCDEMGFLVQEEFFDEWDNPKDKRKNGNEQSVDTITRGYVEHFQEWGERDLKTVIRAHRNHPSIFQWSIGNEIEWTYPRNVEATGFFDADWTGNYFWEQPPHSRAQIQDMLTTLPRGDHDIAETARTLAAWTRELDTTRPVVANCILPSASYEAGFAEALDVIGFSYRRVMYDYGHEHFPNLPLMGTENLPQWHEWKAVIERDFVAGTFLWTGIDYLGESDGQWPITTTRSGLLDRAGFRKTAFHMMKTLWSNEPHLHLTAQTLKRSPYVHDPTTGFIGESDADAWQRKLWFWHDVTTHWNHSDGEMMAVEVYSNCPTVELFLNDVSLGAKHLSDFDDRIYKWAVPFKAGTLEARSREASDVLVTAGTATAIDVVVDGCHVISQLVDTAGRAVRHEEREFVFAASGARILGVDNGAPDSTQDFAADRVTTSQGRALMIIAGAGGVTVSGNGLSGMSVAVDGNERVGRADTVRTVIHASA